MFWIATKSALVATLWHNERLSFTHPLSPSAREGEILREVSAIEDFFGLLRHFVPRNDGVVFLDCHENATHFLAMTKKHRADSAIFV
ncbi:hypothetical protein [Helicobacter sp. 23-1045]